MVTKKQAKDNLESLLAQIVANTSIYPSEKVEINRNGLNNLLYMKYLIKKYQKEFNRKFVEPYLESYDILKYGNHHEVEKYLKEYDYKNKNKED